MKRVLAAVLCVILVAAVMSACGKSSTKTKKSTTSDTTEAAVDTTENSTESEASTLNLEPKTTEALLDINDIPAAQLSNIDTEYQETPPKAGDEVAIIHTNYGDISFKFFPEVAPKAVASFKALAKAGRFDTTIFHRVVNNFVIQGGDYTNFNGTGGGSAFGVEFELEISDYVHNSVGSVAMANRGPGTNGSQFYINQVNNYNLDGDYTVFGQVYDGMDVVNAIAVVDTDYNSAPLSPVVITSVEITTFK